MQIKHTHQIVDGLMARVTSCIALAIGAGNKGCPNVITALFQQKPHEKREQLKRRTEALKYCRARACSPERIVNYVILRARVCQASMVFVGTHGTLKRKALNQVGQHATMDSLVVVRLLWVCKCQVLESQVDTNLRNNLIAVKNKWERIGVMT